MWKKLLIIILSLSIIDVGLYLYLNELIKNKKAYLFKYDDDYLIYQNKEINLNQKEEFILDKYFTILNFNDIEYKSSLDDENNVFVYNDLTKKKYIYKYNLIEPLKIIEENIIYKEVQVETETRKTDENIISSDIDHKIHYLKDCLSFNVGEDLSKIIESLGNNVFSNEKIICDYSSLNPNIKGTYPTYFYNDYDSVCINVQIL